MFKRWLRPDESLNQRMARLLGSSTGPTLKPPQPDQDCSKRSGDCKASIHRTRPEPSAPPAMVYRPTLVYASPLLPEVFVPGRGQLIPQTVGAWLDVGEGNC